MLDNIKEAMFECNEELCKEYGIPYIYDEECGDKHKIVIDCTYSTTTNVQDILDYIFDILIVPSVFEYWPKYKEYEISEEAKIFSFTLDAQRAFTILYHIQFCVFDMVRWNIEKPKMKREFKTI